MPAIRELARTSEGDDLVNVLALQLFRDPVQSSARLMPSSYHTNGHAGQGRRRGYAVCEDGAGWAAKGIDSEPIPAPRGNLAPRECCMRRRRRCVVHICVPGCIQDALLCRFSS